MQAKGQTWLEHLYDFRRSFLLLVLSHKLNCQLHLCVVSSIYQNSWESLLSQVSQIQRAPHIFGVFILLHMSSDFHREQGLCILLRIYKHSDFLVWIYSKCHIYFSVLSLLCVWTERWGKGHKARLDDENQKNTNLINFQMQIFDLLISCADTHSHTALSANSPGIHGGFV